MGRMKIFLVGSRKAAFSLGEEVRILGRGEDMWAACFMSEGEDICAR